MENKKGKLGSRLAGSEAFLSVAASLICIVIGLLLGLVVLAIINAEHAFGDGLLVILKSGFKSPRNMGTVLANAAPLIMTGLSVGFAFKTGLFNIGAAGQYTLGAFGALYCAIVLQWPWYLCLLAAMLFGAIWGALPGIFKAYLNINEVITAIMFNWIGLYMVNDIMYGKGKSPMYDLASTKTYSLRKAAPQAMIPSLGMSELFGKLQSVTIAIFIAIFFAIIVYIILNKTAFGYELRACGFNKNAARYAGINEKRNIILAMMISGALAGVGAGLYASVPEACRAAAKCHHQDYQPGKETGKAVSHDEADNGTTDGSCRPIDVPALNPHEFKRPLQPLEHGVFQWPGVAVRSGHGLAGDAEEQRECLCGRHKENTSAHNHHDGLLDILFLVVHGDVNAYGSDNCNDTCNGIAELHHDRYILGNLLRHCGKRGRSCRVVAGCVLCHCCGGADKQHQGERFHAL